jgi:hypothetical protein
VRPSRCSGRGNKLARIARYASAVFGSASARPRFGVTVPPNTLCANSGLAIVTTALLSVTSVSAVFDATSRRLAEVEKELRALQEERAAGTPAPKRSPAKKAARAKRKALA